MPKKAHFRPLKKNVPIYFSKINPYTLENIRVRLGTFPDLPDGIFEVSTAPKCYGLIFEEEKFAFFVVDFFDFFMIFGIRDPPPTGLECGPETSGSFSGALSNHKNRCQILGIRTPQLVYIPNIL